MGVWWKINVLPKFASPSGLQIWVLFNIILINFGVLALIDSSDPKQYIQRMKRRDPELSNGWVQIAHTLEVPTEGGRQKMLCADTEGIFRIIQSIPSPKAEPFKRWLAKVGYERVKEI